MSDRGDTRKKLEERLFSSLNETPETPPSAPVEVPEDLLDLRRRLDEERRSLSRSKNERTVEEENWTNEDSLAASERFFSSLLLGWGDEMQIATQAQYESMFSDSEETYEDISKRLRREYDERQAGFQERQPGAYLAADIAGAVPSAFVPGLGQAGVAARLGMAGSKAAKAVQTGGRVLAEGAIYGAGEAGEGRRLEGAAEGAVGSTIGYGVLRGATKVGGGVVNVFTRRNVEGDLVDEAGNFVPITLVADKPVGSEGTLHTLYTDVIAPSFGGKGIITQQERKVIEPLEKLIKDKNDMTEEMISSAKEEVAKAKKRASAALTEMKEEFSDVRKEMEKEVTAKTITPLEKKLKLLGKNKDAEILHKVTKKQQQVNDALEHQFRNSAVIESMPAVSTSKDLESVLSIPSIQGQIQKLDELWTKNGYGMVKKLKTRINVNELETSFARMLENDTWFQVNAGSVPSVRDSITKSISSVLKFRDKNNRIDGDILTQLRSDIGKKANQATDDQVRQGLYQAQSQIDDLLKKELNRRKNKTLLRQFESERGKYKSVVVLRDAIESTAKVKGAFKPEDWKKALDKNNKRDKRYGTGTLRRQADSIETSIKDAERAIGRRGNQLAKAKALKIQEVLEDHQAKLKKKITELKTNQKKALSRREQDYDKLVEAERQKPQIKAMQDEVKLLDDRLATLQKLRATEKPSWFHTLAAHQITRGAFGTLAAGVGFATAGPAGAIVAPVAAYGLGKGLASETGQRLMAGQTQPQMTMQRMLKADATGRTADILSKSIGRVVGTEAAQGMLTGGQ
jgi:hypothetical protein